MFTLGWVVLPADSLVSGLADEVWVVGCEHRRGEGGRLTDTVIRRRSAAETVPRRRGGYLTTRAGRPPSRRCGTGR